MAIDPWIARGAPGVDVTNTLAQIAALRQRDRALDIGDQRNALADRDSRQQQITAEQQQQLVARRAEVESIAKAPPAIQARWLQVQASKPGWDKTPVAGLPPEQAIPMMQAELAALLGEKVEQPSQSPSLPGEIQRYEYGLKNPDFRQYEDRNRPTGGGEAQAPADQRMFEYFSRLSPEQQAAYLNMKRSSATPEYAAAIAGAKTTAQEQAKAGVAAKGDLPRIQGNASEMRKVLDQLKTSDGLRFITGAYALAPVAPGTPQADAFAVWEQVQGKAFLEAFNSLKGGGQITEKEGEKATAAITRLSNRKQSLESFKSAIKDLEDVAAAGERRAQQKAGAASENDPLGIR